MKLFWILPLLLLTGCTPKYNEAITCPDFAATNIEAYKLDSTTYVVVNPDKSFHLVSAPGCVVYSPK